MELKLNVYNGRQIEKTYTAQGYELMYGTVEDLLNALDLEALTNTSDTDGMVSAASRLLNSRKDVIEPLLMDVFDGLTPEELRRTKARDVLGVIVGLAGFSIDQLRGLAFRGRK